MGGHVVLIGILTGSAAESGDFDSAVRYEEQALAGKAAPPMARERRRDCLPTSSVVPIGEQSDPLEVSAIALGA
jgi:hypothetical protein